MYCLLPVACLLLISIIQANPVYAQAYDSCQLIIISNPSGAEIIINDHSVGQTPDTIRSACGFQYVKIWKYLSSRFDTLLDVQPNQRILLRVNLRSICESINLSSHSQPAIAITKVEPNYHLVEGQLVYPNLCSVRLAFWSKQGSGNWIFCGLISPDHGLSIENGEWFWNTEDPWQKLLVIAIDSTFAPPSTSFQSANPLTLAGSKISVQYP